MQYGLTLLLLFAVSLNSCKKKDQDTITKANAPMLLVLDAAHGGNDIGSTSPEGLMEKDLVLKLCNKMALLGWQYNIQVVLTRKDENAVTWEDRVAISNTSKADLFLSMHIKQSTPTLTVNGYEIYVSEENPKYAESERLANAIASKLVTAGTPTQVIKKGIYVLTNNMHPSIAIECGDINKPSDAEMLTNDTKLETLCRTMLSGMVAYRNAQ